MQREFRLKDEDLLDLTHFPIKAAFDMVDHGIFSKVINSVCEGVGFGEEYGACTFPGDLDEYDIANGDSFEGVEFVLYSGDEVIIDYQTLYHYLKKCARVIQKSIQTQLRD
ncbi:ribonuclease toxin immunity protein CdiI [Bacillus sp. SM-B1]|nr:ribonuclease toxin immunity protein CdiI [Bacillus sp. SM-B1]MDV6036128.1 ribonuclease toxin immunity protein CdiI [Bacillus sp. SM-B1]